MNADPITASEQIDKYRERFSAWGLVFASACIAMVVWTTATHLEVDMPLVADTSVKLNIGYPLAIGMPAICIVFAWIIGPLIGIRRIQRSVIEKQIDDGSALDELAKIRFHGAICMPPSTRFERAVVWVALWSRMLVLFGAPVLAEIAIANSYFFGLDYYFPDEVKPQIVQDSYWPYHTNHRVTMLDHLVGIELPIKNKEIKERWKKDDMYFKVRNHILEEKCISVWKMTVSTDAKRRADSGASKSSEKREPPEVHCVLDSFPRFELPYQSWINVLSLLGVFVIAAYGIRVYLGKGLPRPTEPL
jgi:hypothetical protein